MMAGSMRQAGSAWRKGIVKGNKLFPLTACAIRMLFHLRENCGPPSEKKTKRYEMQKFRVVRLQIAVRNRADSGHRQTA